MKKTLKLKERLGAFCLAVLFAVQAILGLLPVNIVHAGVSAIEIWKPDQMIDYDYRFNMKYQPGITTYETFGCDNQDRNAFTDYGRSTRDAETVRVSNDYKAGSAGVRYNNVGKDQNGNVVDVKITLMEVHNAEPRYDIRTPATKTEDNGGMTFAWENNESYPVVAFARNNIGVFTYSVGSVKVNFQFLKHGTDEALTISGHGTIRDIDAAQAIEIPSDSNIDRAYIEADNDFLKVNGTYVGSQNEAIEPDDKKGWLNMLYQTDNFNLIFSHQEKLDMWDESRQNSINKAGSVEKWTQGVKNKYVDASGKTYCATFQGQKFCKGFAYFDFTSYCLGDIEMKKEPEKRVGETGCSWEDAAVTSREQPFIMKECDEFQYMIRAEVTPNRLKSFVVQDVLEDCLAMDDVSKVSVINDAGQNVTDQFRITIEGQQVVCSALQESLQDEAFTDNQTYTFILKVHRRPETEINASGYLAEDGYSILVPNHASMSYERVNGTGGTMDTETVWVKGVIPPELEVTKNTSQYEWKTGDIVDYEVTVTQVKPDVQAVNVTVTDEIPGCLQLVEGQYVAETSAGSAPCTLTREGENGWRVECPFLKSGERITVRFKCQALENSNGQEWENIVSATAENLINPETGEQESRKDLAEVWPNSPQLEIDKTADTYEWQTGQEVAYRIVVNNVIPGTIAKDVTVTDIGLPEGLLLSGGADSVEVLGVQQQINYPVPDKKTGQAFEARQVDSSLEADGKGFAFYCSYLPYSQPITLIFHCTAQETANGHESINAATAKASNAEEKSDDAEVYVNTGEFWIEKTADHYEWQTGEQVEYKVVVENKKEGTIARNVTVWDTQMPAGLALVSSDSVSVTGIPQSIVQPVAGTPDVPGQLNPEFYNETAEKTVSYEFLPEGNGWRLNISDLPAGVPVTISFLCVVTEEANGMESVNVANVQAKNAPETADDAEVYVNTAMLSIEKGVQNPYLAAGDGRLENEFRTGEQVHYQVTVNNLQKGSIARNLVISDLSLPEGLALDGDEDAVTVNGVPAVIQNPVAGTDDVGNELNPENYRETVEKAVNCQVVRQGTGWIVMISDLPYQTPVTVNFHCTAQDNINGMEIVNTAQAYADNAAPVKDTSKVWINSPVMKVEKTADKPFYKYGDIITYRISVTQEQTGCVARDLTIYDVIDTPGVKLLKDSVVLMDEKGNLIDAGLEANEDNTFTVSTGRALVKDTRYNIWDNDRGGVFEQVMYNPLDCTEQKKMTVEYQAAVVDMALAGQKVHNAATADSRENIPASDEEIVEVYSPILEIVKESDKKEYVSGETGYYKLTVRQLREDVTDTNIIVEDALQTPGGKIKKDSILVKKNGTELKDIKVDSADTGFAVSTGTELSDMDKIEVFYEVLFETEGADTETVVNVAKTRGDLSPETTAQQEVYVKTVSEPEPTPTETPVPTETPTPTEVPEPTKVPTETPEPTKAPAPTETPKQPETPAPEPTKVPDKTPAPTTPGTCPKMTQAPTRTPAPSYSSGTNGTGNGGSTGSGGYGSTGGYSSGYGSYQGGSVAGSSKTGDTRPFRVMAVLGILGVVLLAGGAMIYRRTGKEISKKRRTSDGESRR